MGATLPASSSSRCRPLRWPIEMLRPTENQRFLMGIPFVGIDKRARRQLVRQLKDRGPECMRLWPDDPKVRRALQIISPVIKFEFDWPNTYFVPDDLCSILFWAEPLRGWELLHERLGQATLQLDKTLSDRQRFLDTLDSLSYGELINRIARLPIEATPTAEPRGCAIFWIVVMCAVAIGASLMGWSRVRLYLEEGELANAVYVLVILVIVLLVAGSTMVSALRKLRL